MKVQGKKRIILFLLSFAFCFWHFAFVGAGSPPPLFQEIEQRGYLIAAVKDNLPPLGFRDAKGNLQGLEIDLARRLAKELLGSENAVELQPVANQDRLAVVLDGKVDLAIARVTATPVRSRVVSFSPPYYIDGTTLVTRDPSVRQLSDVASGRIAVLNGSSTIAVVRYLMPQTPLVGVDSYQAARSLLETGGASAFAGDASVLTGWVQESPQYRLLPVRLSDEPLAVVMPKGRQYADLRQRVNDAIARWQADGWLRERASSWGLPVASDRPTSSP